MHLDDALGLIAEVPDFPQPGVSFRDLSPLLAHGEAFRLIVDALAKTIASDVELVVGLEARGFPLAAAVAYTRGCGLALARKPGKLPLVASRVEYALEYGTASLEFPQGVLRAGQKVHELDDVLATGGTIRAACTLIEKIGGEIAGCSVVVELNSLAGRSILTGRNVRSLFAV